MSTELDELEEINLKADLRGGASANNGRKYVAAARARRAARPQPKWKHQLAMHRKGATKAGKK